MLCLAFALAGCSAKMPANQGIADAEITTGVEAAFAAESSLADFDLTVSTDDGVVRIAGLVADEEDRASAETIAAASRGVVSVDNWVRYGE